MPVYEYTALNGNGKACSGIVEAESAAAARSRLRSDGRYPTSIREAHASPAAPRLLSSTLITLLERIRPAEVNLLMRQLATMVGAGIPVDVALGSIAEQIANPALKKVTVQLRESIIEGEPLSRAMQRFDRLFSDMQVNMVRAGEASGSLDRVLTRLADFGERQQVLLLRIRSAMVYPLFMALVGSGILFFLITYIVPAITDVFVDMEQVLPWSTRLLIAVSTVLRDWWWVLLTAIGGCWLATKALLDQDAVRTWWDLVKLKLPLFGPLLCRAAAARFASTMSSLLSGGVEVVTAVAIGKRIVGNAHVAADLDRAAEEIRQGRTMAATLSGSRWFPSMFVQMVAVGEATGTLEEMFSKIAAAGEHEVETAVLGLTALLEPLMIVVMGGIVGFIVLSILLPIFEMNQMVG